MKISIESEDLETRQKRDKSGNYSIQQGYAHLVEKDGSPMRYPVQCQVFPPRNAEGAPIAYKKGQYIIADTSFRVAQNGFLEIGFMNLIPAK